MTHFLLLRGNNLTSVLQMEVNGIKCGNMYIFLKCLPSTPEVVHINLLSRAGLNVVGNYVTSLDG